MVWSLFCASAWSAGLLRDLRPCWFGVVGICVARAGASLVVGAVDIRDGLRQEHARCLFGVGGFVSQRWKGATKLEGARWLREGGSIATRNGNGLSS